MLKNKNNVEFALEGNSSEYITLKEAAEISDYAPDYIGQLIRAGKIEGKQVYSNVSWVTTREAVLSYMSSKGKGDGTEGEASLLDRWEDVARWFLYGVIGLSMCALMVLLYVLAVTVDRQLSETYVSENAGAGAVEEIEQSVGVNTL